MSHTKPYIIAHRGNMNGPNPAMENHPEYISEAIKNDFDVEIDVWIIENKFFLGHDKPIYKVTEEWIKSISDPAWFHAKNIQALFKLKDLCVNCFWHENDRCTISNDGYIIHLPGSKDLSKIRSVLVTNENREILKDFELMNRCFGICTDYALEAKELFKGSSKTIDNISNIIELGY